MFPVWESVRPVLDNERELNPYVAPITDITPLRLSLNVSAQQIMQGDFIKVLPQILEEKNFPPHLLEIEITESGR